MADGRVVFMLIITIISTVVRGYHDKGVFYLHHPFCNGSGVELIPKSDCSGFYICADGRTYEETCQDGWVFSHGAHGCVPRGTFIDDCENVTQKCTRDSSGVFPHDLECQLFYNCSNNNTVTFTINRGALSPIYVTEPFLQECAYPQLFNTQTLVCDDFVDVVCGVRHEIVAKCKYWAYKSKYGTQSPPCTASNPTCEGLADGENTYVEREWSPYFTYCFQGRTTDIGYCPSLNVTDIVSDQIFHPELRMCVPRYRIPWDHGGLMPDCSNQPDGPHPIHSTLGSCRYYFICEDGEFDDVYRCPDEMFFDVILRNCVNQSTARCKLL